MMKIGFVCYMHNTLNEFEGVLATSTKQVLDFLFVVIPQRLKDLVCQGGCIRAPYSLVPANKIKTPKYLDFSKRENEWILLSTRARGAASRL